MKGGNLFDIFMFFLVALPWMGIVKLWEKHIGYKILAIFLVVPAGLFSLTFLVMLKIIYFILRRI